MKQLILLILASIFFFGCSDKEKTKVEAFNAEAFAYDVGDYYEVNASTRVKGLQQEETDGRFKSSVSFDIHIVTPAGDTVKSLISKSDDKTFSEMQPDIPLEAQFELDTTYLPGKYKLIFDVKDISTEQHSFSSAEFELE